MGCGASSVFIFWIPLWIQALTRKATLEMSLLFTLIPGQFSSVFLLVGGVGLSNLQPFTPRLSQFYCPSILCGAALRRNGFGVGQIVG